MNRTIRKKLVITSVVALLMFLAVSSTYAEPDYTSECGGCHTPNPSFTMSSNSTGNATIEVPFTLRITAQKPSMGGVNFYLSVQAGWADNDEFSFTPFHVQDGSGEDLTSANWNVTYDFTFTPNSVGNYTIRAWCSTGSSSQSIDIPIDVKDIPDVTAPTVDSPSDIEYNVLTTGHNITWTPYDENPSHFDVDLNGTSVLSGVWDGQPIYINIDYLGPGTYEYTLIAFDIGGNNVTDIVIVTVTGEVPTTTTTTTSTTTTTTTTTTTGGSTGTPVDDEKLIETTTFSFIILAMGGIVGVLSFLLILDRWRS